MNRAGNAVGRYLVRVGVVLLTCCLPWAGAAAMDFRPGISVEVEPGSDTGTFVGTVVVRDLDSNTILASPGVQFSAGTSGSADIDLAAQQAKVHVDIAVDPTLTRASWTCSVSGNGQTAFEFSGGVTLRAAVQQGY
jgi:hypothetical protein